MKLPKTMHSIFWDINPNEIDEKKHRNFLITRIAEKGRWSDVLWLRKKYSVGIIKRVVSKSENTSDKTKNFWKII